MSEQRGRTAYYKRGNYLRIWLLLVLCDAASAFGECEQAAGRLESSEGTVNIEQAGSWQPLTIGACVPVGVRVQVSGGRAVFLLANETLLRASGNTLLQFSTPEKKSWVHLFDGVLHFITRTPRAFDVQTDYVNAGVKGTEFLFEANSTERYGQIVMLEGEVLASNEHGQQSVRGGAAVTAREGQAPQLLTIPALRDAVQWTLYYPPLPVIRTSRFQPVLDRFYRSDTAGAIAQLEVLPISDRDADYFTLVAAIELHHGEVTRAHAALDRALTLQPDHPSALALQATSALTVGELAQAAALLDRAQAPRDTAVLIARSYLQQARFELPAALKSAQQAAAINAGDALIQARIAELALMNDKIRQASVAVSKAIELQPEFARAHAIGGFVRLQQLEFDRAETAFKHAAELDAADPLPRLGLGLINIRHNRVHEGREQLALAVALDPGQSLLRSYLGKAYQEEGREHLARDQYMLAKAFDTADPTPWFYSALLARAQNRPFDALDDLNQSIVRNDNRAVYRSRLQLDADEAARTASQAEIYRELGFDALAQVTAARAVSTAPGEYGGHRQLAEAYADDPQYDAARASEVLQAQLLQPLSATPVMPLLGEKNLLAIEGAGPSALGFREYNAMFVREKPWLSVSGLGGSNGTGANEIALTGIYDRIAYALNQYHYETAGHRENSHARYDILSAYSKFQANDDLSFLFQASHKEENLGNLDETISSQDFLLHIEDRGKTDAFLVGGNLKLTPTIDMLAVVGFQEGDGVRHITTSLADQRTESKTRASNAEFQWQFGDLPGHLIAGADFATIEKDWAVRTITSSPVLDPPPVDDTERFKTGYAYWTVSPLTALELTAGLAYAQLDTQLSADELSGWYPKVSAYYHLTDSVDVHVAYFESLRRPYSVEQTIEPTQIGGFNQLYDETDGTESDNYAMGVNIRVAAGHRFGAEAVLREFRLPYDTTVEVEDRLARVYWNWAFAPWAISLDYRHENSEYTIAGIEGVVAPPERATRSVPFQVKWVHHSGFAAAATTTYFHQRVEGNETVEQETTHFTLVNMVASYRFPQRQAEVELRCSNLFDEEFRYENASLVDSTPRISPFIPERIYAVGLKFIY